MPSHHPRMEYLLDYASGASLEPTALMIATHLTLCPACRREVSMLEALGAALVHKAPELKEDADDTNALLARLLEHLGAETHGLQADLFPGKSSRKASSGADEISFIPQPLRQYMPGGQNNLDWHNFGGLRIAQLLKAFPKYWLALCHLEPGSQVPEHTHVGREMLLVLSGSLHDENGHYLRGDLVDFDENTIHTPTADPARDCFFLALNEYRPVHTGAFGWFYNFLNRFIG